MNWLFSSRAFRMISNSNLTSLTITSALKLHMLFDFQAVTTPAMSVSHIMLEANKKYILVSMLLHGKVSASIIQL